LARLKAFVFCSHTHREGGEEREGKRGRGEARKRERAKEEEREGVSGIG